MITFNLFLIFQKPLETFKNNNLDIQVDDQTPYPLSSLTSSSPMTFLLHDSKATHSLQLLYF